MHTTIRTLVLFSSIVAVASCTPVTSPDDGTDLSSSEQVSSEDTTGTHNVSYTGVIDELGITIYQQGTHRLTLPDERFVLLQSDSPSVDLDEYIGRQVEVRGSSRPTVEAGGTIMSVEQIIALEQSSSSVSSEAVARTFCGGIAALPCPANQMCIDDPADDCDPNNGGADCGGICVPEVSFSSSAAIASSASVTANSVTRPPVSSVSNVSSAASSSPAVPSELEAEITLMATKDYATSALWTQRYCTDHVGFCTPVHKEWYFQSFGSKAGTLWHVEFGMAEIVNVNDGPIRLDLVSGASASKNKSDGEVAIEGSQVVGYRDLGDRHFEISGDARLKAAIEFMTKNLQIN